MVHEAKALRIYVETGDSLKVFKKLPRHLLRLFINAYQSYVFNKLLSRLVRSYHMEFHKVLGVCRRNGKYLLPVPGYRVRGWGDVGSTLEDIMASDEVSFELFKVPELGLKIPGSWREAYMKISDLSWNIVDDYEIELRFRLSKGMYATTILREIGKCDPLLI